MNDHDDDKMAEEALEMIIKGAGMLGWQAAFKRPPDGDENASIEYIIVGTEAEVDRILDILEAPQNRI